MSSETWTIVFNAASGEARSISSDPVPTLPSGLASVTVTASEVDQLNAGEARWDAPTRLIVPVVPAPLPEVTIDQMVVWLDSQGIDADQAIREAAAIEQ